MQGTSGTPANSRNLAQPIAHGLAAVLLGTGGVLAIGALWLPWRHFVVYGDTSLIEPQDLAPYVPISQGWAHSFIVFTVLALVAGILALIADRRGRSEGARVLALMGGLFAGAGILFATLGVDGAEVWLSSEATDAGYRVCVAGYVAMIVASGVVFVSATVASMRRSQITGDDDIRVHDIRVNEEA